MDKYTYWILFGLFLFVVLLVVIFYQTPSQSTEIQIDANVSKYYDPKLLLKQTGAVGGSSVCNHDKYQQFNWINKKLWFDHDGNIKKLNDDDNKYWDESWESRLPEAMSTAMKVDSSLQVPKSGCCGALQGIKLAYNVDQVADRIYDYPFASTQQKVPEPSEGIPHVQGAGIPEPINY